MKTGVNGHAETMLSLYISSPTWLHRLPPSFKLIGLAVASVALLPTQNLALLIVTTTAGCLGFLSLGGPGYRRLVNLLRTTGSLAVLIGLFQFILIVGELGSLQATVTAIISALRLLSLVLLGDLVSVTTPLNKILNLLNGLLRPLKTLGARTEKLSLVVGLMIRAGSLLRQRLDATGNAYRARGGKSAGFRIVAPLIRNAINGNRSLAEALQSRALRGPSHQNPAG